MSVHVVVLQGAEADLRELRRYVCHRFGAKRWAGTLQSIHAAFLRIAEHPETGHLPEELATMQLVQYRQLPTGKNRIIYELRGDLAFVHVACDARRDLRAVLMRRLVASP